MKPKGTVLLALIGVGIRKVLVMRVLRYTVMVCSILQIISEDEIFDSLLLSTSCFLLCLHCDSELGI